MITWIALAVAAVAVLALVIRARSAPIQPSRRRTAAFIAVMLPMAAAAVYLMLGAPGLPENLIPKSEQTRQADAETKLKALEARLAQTPTDAILWIKLGQSRRGLNKYASAADAFAQAIELGQAQPAVKGAYGEMLVLAADGSVTFAARKIFEKALAADPREPRSRYYIGLAELQANEVQRAIDIWLDLEVESSTNAPWMSNLKARLQDAAKKHGIDLEARRAAHRASREGGKDKAQIDKKDNGDADKSDVAKRGAAKRLAKRLERKPRDLEGWRQLGRDWTALGERDKAAGAFDRAAALAPDNIEVMVEYGQALIAARGGESPDQRLDPAIVNVMLRILDLDGGNTTALWYLGLAELQFGNKSEARGYWRKLLAVLPEDNPERAEFERRIAALKVMLE